MNVMDWLWLIVLFSTIAPVIEFFIIKAQVHPSGFLSIWIGFGTIYGMLAVYAEVYYADYLVKTHWWQDRVIEWWRRVINSKPNINGNGVSDPIRKMEYLGLFLATSSFIFGKPAVIIYANNKQALPYGYWYLTAGWWFRLVWEFYGVKLILGLFTNVS